MSPNTSGNVSGKRKASATPLSARANTAKKVQYGNPSVMSGWLKKDPAPAGENASPKVHASSPVDATAVPAAVRSPPVSEPLVLARDTAVPAAKKDAVPAAKKTAVPAAKMPLLDEELSAMQEEDWSDSDFQENAASASRTPPSLASEDMLAGMEDWFDTDLKDTAAPAAQETLALAGESSSSMDNDEQPQMAVQDLQGKCKKYHDLVVALSDDGANVELDLHAVLTFRARHIFVWCQVFLDEEVTNELVAEGASSFATTFIDGMKVVSSELVLYLEECFSRGVPWDMRVVKRHIDKSTATAKDKQGLYMVLLQKSNTDVLYGGSSGRYSGEGMQTRFRQHLDPKHRASHKSKVLYQQWKTTPTTGKFEKGWIKPFLLLPRTYVATRGIHFLLMLETMMASLFCLWGPEWSGMGGLDPNVLLPRSLVDAFRQYCDSHGAAIAPKTSNMAVLGKALMFATGKPLMGANMAIPLLDTRVGQACGFTMLCKGLTPEFHVFKDNSPKFYVHGLSITITQDDWAKLNTRGFTFQSADIQMRLWRAPARHQNHCARLPLGVQHEYADQLVMSLSWTDSQCVKQSLDLAAGGTAYGVSASRTGPLERACWILSLWEYGQKILPNEEPKNGYYRFDLAHSRKTESQGPKAWDSEREASRPFKCPYCHSRFMLETYVNIHVTTTPACRALRDAQKLRDQAARAEGRTLMCKNPACPQEFTCHQGYELGGHFGFQRNGMKNITSIPCAKWLKEQGISSKEEFQQQIAKFLVEGASLAKRNKTFETKQYKCVGHSKALYYQDMYGLKQHIFGVKPNERTEANKKIECLKAHGLSTELMFKTFGKTEAAAFKNPDYVATG